MTHYNEQMTHARLALTLFDRFDLIINTFTISKTLYVMKINKKSLRRIVSERSQFYHNAYFLTINDFTYD